MQGFFLQACGCFPWAPQVGKVNGRGVTGRQFQSLFYRFGAAGRLVRLQFHREVCVELVLGESSAGEKLLGSQAGEQVVLVGVHHESPVQAAGGRALFDHFFEDFDDSFLFRLRDILSLQVREQKASQRVVVRGARRVLHGLVRVHSLGAPLTRREQAKKSLVRSGARVEGQVELQLGLQRLTPGLEAELVDLHGRLLVGVLG